MDFLNAVTRASADAEVETVDMVRKSISDDWRAGAWFLEHRYPDKWGKRRFEHTGKDGDAVIIRTAMYMDEL